MAFEVITMVIAVILALGMIGEKDKGNKRTYCYAFVACIIAVAVMRGGLL